MSILLKNGDIVKFRHIDKNGRTSRHPFIIFKIENNKFYSLQITSSKFNRETGQEILTKF